MHRLCVVILQFKDMCSRIKIGEIDPRSCNIESKNDSKSREILQDGDNEIDANFEQYLSLNKMLEVGTQGVTRVLENESVSKT